MRKGLFPEKGISARHSPERVEKLKMPALTPSNFATEGSFCIKNAAPRKMRGAAFNAFKM